MWGQHEQRELQWLVPSSYMTDPFVVSSETSQPIDTSVMTALLIHESGFSIHLGVSYCMVIVTDSASSLLEAQQFHLPSYCS